MKGYELSKSFFTEWLYPILSDEYRPFLADLAVGFVGDGSEILGFDDEISQDHNFCPRVVVFVADERFADIGHKLRNALRARAPVTHLGFKLQFDEVRQSIQVVPLQQFFLRYLHMKDLPSTNQAWLKLDEQGLVELTSGQIFFDPLGKLQKIREQLVFYPEAVRYFLLYQGFIRLSEVGALERLITRHDYIAMELYRAFFIYFAIKVLHLYKRKYCPYRKWMGKSLEQLGQAGGCLKAQIEALVRTTALDQIKSNVNEILVYLATLLLTELDCSPESLLISQDLHLLNFDWDRVLTALKAQLPADLQALSPLITPLPFWGLLFDISGLGGNYESVLQANLHFLHEGNK